MPAPSCVMLTVVADPPKVLSLTITDSVPHVLPAVLLRVNAGGSAHTQEMSNELPVVVQASAFLTVMTWLPLSTLLKVVADWNVPPSRLYSSPEPIGLVTVTTAFPAPCVQSTVCEGAGGEGG